MKHPLFISLVWASLLLAGCDQDEPAVITPSVVYRVDGRSTRLGNPSPVALDVNEDGQVDYTLFVELTANSQGDRLYVGMNPIGLNEIKSGPAIDENFLNMGFLVAETPGALINAEVGPNQLWTSDFGALVIRNTRSNGQVFYEGDWQEASQLVGIRHQVNGLVYYGWLRINFDRLTEEVTLVDYAYDAQPGQPMVAGGQ